MKSNYSSLGDYIRELKVRNTEEKAEQLLGINIDKFFMPSVANVVGTDLSVYKIVKKNQFACNRMHVGRDYRLPISMSKSDVEFMVSPAYDVFEIKDSKILDPEYLMMWFSRKEFDRNAWFYTDADVRGGLPWRSFCDMQLPIPPITKQKEIVKEYNVIQNRITLNQKLIKKLEETAQAIYKQWFVEFEFPDENGMRYKSNGGEMVWNEELQKEIPKGWEVGKLGDLFDVVNGYAFGSYDFSREGIYPIIKIANIISPDIELETAQYFSGDLNNSMKKSVVRYGDILISMTGSHMNQINSAVGKIGRYNYCVPAILNQRVGKLSPKFKCSEFLFRIMLKAETQKEILMAATGSANQANISPETIKGVNLIIPSSSILKMFEDSGTKINTQRNNYEKQNRKLKELQNLLLSKLATIEN
ncbi:MAG: restriction endonuclease subunit S [Cyclobacteriaceae bacterium]|nr:restriction endonuclease subunit S [Cyclobacteriaceae bacterium]